MKALILALALLLVGCESAEVRAKRSVAYLEFTGGGVCSGTMVGPAILLTASHCFETADLLAVNRTPVNVVSWRDDGADHRWLVLEIDPGEHARMGQAPKQGDKIFLYGNPHGREDFFRVGYVVGQDENAIYIDMPIGHGDSGAAIFNHRGEVVGVITGYAERMGFRLGVVRPFAP